VLSFADAVVLYHIGEGNDVDNSAFPPREGTLEDTNFRYYVLVFAQWFRQTSHRSHIYIYNDQYKTNQNRKKFEQERACVGAFKSEGVDDRRQIYTVNSYNQKHGNSICSKHEGNVPQTAYARDSRAA
jgi:hypothetical protein